MDYVVRNVLIGEVKTRLVGLKVETIYVDARIYYIYWGRIETNLEILGCNLRNDGSTDVYSEIFSAWSKTPPCNSLSKITLETEYLDMDGNETYKLSKVLETKRITNSMNKYEVEHQGNLYEWSRKNQQSYQIQLKAIQAVYTATFLAWCYCNSLHTDSVVWNKFMKMSNGNRPGKVKEFLNVMYQNLPGTLGVDTLSTALTGIVERIHPDVLFVGEAESNNVKQACPEGYNWVGGFLKE